MPDATYNLVYDVGGNAAAQIDDLIAKLTQLGALADQVKPKLAALSKDMARPLSAATKAAQALGASLGTLSTQAGSASQSVQKVAAVSSAASAAATGAASQYSAAAAAFGAAGNAATSATPSLQAMKTATAGVGSGATKAAASVGSFITQGLALRAVHGVFSTVFEESKKVEEYWQKLAKEATDFRESLRELASLQGQSGPNNKVVANVLDLALTARLTGEKAADLSASYENYGPTVREKGHYAPAQGTPEELEKSIVAEAGKTARRLGVNEKAMGAAVGTAGMFHKFTSKEDAMEQLGGALEGLSLGSVEYTPGINALTKAAAKLVDPKEAAAEGAVAGRVGSYADAGVYLGALSLGTGSQNPNLAGERMVQVSRLLHPDPQKRPEAVEALRKAGVTPQMEDPDALIRLSEYLDEQKVTDRIGWLSSNNLGTDYIRVAAVAAMKQASVLKSRLAKVRKSRKTNEIGRQTVASNASFMATDRSASASGVESITDVIDKATGVESPEEFEKAKQLAEQRSRVLNPKYTDPLWRGMLHLNTLYTYPMYGVSGVGQHQEHGAIAVLKHAGGKVGVDVEKQFPGLASGDYQTRAKAFTQASEAVKAKGGDPLMMEPFQSVVRKKVQGLDVPAQRPAAPLAPGAPGTVGPQASNGSQPPSAAVALDPQLAAVNRDQLAVLKRMEAKMGGGRNESWSSMGPLPVDGGNYEPRRA